MAVGDSYKVLVKGSINGFPAENTFWFYHNGGAGGTETAEYLAGYVEFNWCRELEPLICDIAQFDSVEAYNWKNPAELGAVSSVVVGNILTSALPTWMCATISWNRAGAGYNYPQKRVWGIAEADTDINTPDTQLQTDLLAVADALCAFTMANNAQMRLMAVSPQPPLGTDPVANPAYRTQFPTSALRVRLGTQKTRR